MNFTHHADLADLLQSLKKRDSKQRKREEKRWRNLKLSTYFPGSS